MNHFWFIVFAQKFGKKLFCTLHTLKPTKIDKQIDFAFSYLNPGRINQIIHFIPKKPQATQSGLGVWEIGEKQKPP